MEKSLLDILNEEYKIIEDINILSRQVKRTSDYRINILMNCPDCKAKTKDLARLQSEIDHMNNSIIEHTALLEDVRRKLASYIKNLLR